MAQIHRAVLTPTKAELLTEWLPSRPWSGVAPADPIELVGAYRFDDPAGRVGIETHLVRTPGGDVLQVPLTYRDAPLDEAEAALVGTMQHSVLGRRWVYDGCADPVYVSTLAATILVGGREADQWVDSDEGPWLREPTVRVSGSGTADVAAPVLTTMAVRHDPTTTTIDTADVELVVLRTVGAARPGDVETLTGTWAGQDHPALLAFARLRG